LKSEENAAAFCERVINKANAAKETPASAVTQEPYGGSVIGGAMTEECLISPLQFYLHNPKEEQKTGEYWNADLYGDEYKISNDAAFEYLDAIELAVLREREKNQDKTHGMAEYLPDELQKKVWSMFPSIEFYGDGIYCVTKMELTAPLTPEETALLKDDWRGQLSDGWGEGFTQREIKVGREELYVSTWTSDNNVFFIDTQEEFNRRIGAAPRAIDADKAFTEFTANKLPIPEFSVNHGFMENAVNGLMAYARDIAAKSVNGWPKLVGQARETAINIAQYGGLRAPYDFYGSDWKNAFDDAIINARNFHNDIPEKSAQSKESALRGLAWFACEMADTNDSRLLPRIAEVQCLMSEMASLWGFDKSLHDELNAIVNEAKGIIPSDAPKNEETGYTSVIDCIRKDKEEKHSRRLVSEKADKGKRQNKSQNKSKRKTDEDR